MKKIIGILVICIIIGLTGVGIYKYTAARQASATGVFLTVNGKSYKLSTSRITITRVSTLTDETVEVKEITDSDTINKIINACTQHQEVFQPVSSVDTWNNVNLNFHNGTAMGIVTSHAQGDVIDHYEATKGLVSGHGYQIPNELITLLREILKTKD